MLKVKIKLLKIFFTKSFLLFWMNENTFLFFLSDLFWIFVNRSVFVTWGQFHQSKIMDSVWIISHPGGHVHCHSQCYLEHSSVLTTPPPLPSPQLPQSSQLWSLQCSKWLLNQSTVLTCYSLSVSALWSTLHSLPVRAEHLVHLM